jgi:hypothetical protein
MKPSEIRSSIETIQALADNRKWKRLREDSINVELVLLDARRKLSPDAFVDLLEYIENRLGIALLIAGGGYSCIKIGLHSSEDDIPKLGHAIEDDMELGSVDEFTTDELFGIP